MIDLIIETFFTMFSMTCGIGLILGPALIFSYFNLILWAQIYGVFIAFFLIAMLITLRRR